MPATASKDTETLERLLSTRHSCRGFLREPVADDLIVRILSISQRTPSWCNAQPWQVIITKGPATERFRRALCDYVAKNPPTPDMAFPREYRGAYLERRRACGFRLYEAVGVARGDREAYAKQGFENSNCSARHMLQSSHRMRRSEPTARWTAAPT